MSNKDILLISYYWPPLGGASVQRWLKFIKYLSKQGYTCHVYTPSNPSFELIDESLEKEIPSSVSVIKSEIWEPHSLFNGKKKGSKKSKTSKKQNPKSLKNKIGHWVRGNLFIPDSRVFWVKPSIKILEKYIKENNISHIITTGPPHSMHLVGLGLKKKYPSIHWVADFRDPWSQWEKYLNEFFPTAISLQWNKNLEKKVLQNADSVLTISPTYVKMLEKISNRKIELLTNGFDEADFEDYTPIDKKPIFFIRHIGTIDLRRNPIPFLEKLNSFLESNSVTKEIKFEFIGNVDKYIRQEIESKEWNYSITFIDYVPHSEIIRYYEKTSALVLILASGNNAKGNIPGKLFEYLASKIPIIGIGEPTGDSAFIINETQSGKVFSHTQSQKEFNIAFQAILEKENENSANNLYQKYSRHNLTKKLAQIMHL